MDKASIAKAWLSGTGETYNWSLWLNQVANKSTLGNLSILFFFFFDLGFTALSRIFHLYRADRSSKVGENRRTRRKTTWPSVSRTWLSHIWPKSEHSKNQFATVWSKDHSVFRGLSNLESLQECWIFLECDKFWELHCVPGTSGGFSILLYVDWENVFLLVCWYMSYCCGDVHKSGVCTVWPFSTQKEWPLFQEYWCGAETGLLSSDHERIVSLVPDEHPIHKGWHL